MPTKDENKQNLQHPAQKRESDASKAAKTLEKGKKNQINTIAVVCCLQTNKLTRQKAREQAASNSADSKEFELCKHTNIVALA